MRTIDFLVQELPKLGSWPDGAVAASFLCSKNTLSFANENGGCPSAWRFIVNCDVEDRCIEVTREQYEAALAAKNDGWIEWGGGNCPVEKGMLIDVKHRDGEIYQNKPAMGDNNTRWSHTGSRGDIIAYRLHKPQEAEQAKADDEADLNECIGQDAAPVWNGEGLPPVGMEIEYSFAKVNYRTDFSRGKVLAYGMQNVFMEHWASKNEFIQPLDKIEFRPIRSEADKKREDALDAIYGAIASAERAHNRSDEADKVYEAIAAGKIPGVKLDN